MYKHSLMELFSSNYCRHAASLWPLVCCRDSIGHRRAVLRGGLLGTSCPSWAIAIPTRASASILWIMRPIQYKHQSQKEWSVCLLFMVQSYDVTNEFSKFTNNDEMKSRCTGAVAQCLQLFSDTVCVVGRKPSAQ